MTTEETAKQLEFTKKALIVARSLFLDVVSPTKPLDDSSNESIKHLIHLIDEYLGEE
jgi:hypothetical protein